MLHSCHYVVLDGTWRRRNKCGSHESMPIYQQKKKNQLLNYNLVEIICLVLVGIPTFITHDNIADWTSFFVCVHFFLIDFQAWCFLCWGTKHRRGPRTAGPPGSATTHTGYGDPGHAGKRAAPNNHSFFRREWFDCRINRPLFLGVIAVALVHGRPKLLVWPQQVLKKGSFRFHRSVANAINHPQQHPANMSGRVGPRPPPTTSSGVVGRPLRGGHAGRSRQPGRPYAPSRQCFEGETEAMKGHVYDLIGSKSTGLFITTTKQIAGYVGQTYTQGGDIHLAVENLTLPILEGPAAPTTTDALTIAIFHEEVKEFVKRTKKLEENVQLLWALLWGQALDAVHTKLEAQRDHEDMRQRSTGVELLNAIKDLMYNVQELKYIPLAIHLA